MSELNMDIDENIVTLEQVLEAHQFLKSSPDMVRTPTLLHVQSMFTKDVKGPKSSGLSSKVDATSLHKVDLFMKMENMQTTGSFKIRGVLNQMRKVKERHGKQCKLITMSAGNYGKAFAHCVGKSSPGSACVMPQTAPAHKAKLIENMGVEVHKVDTSKLMEEVNRLVKEEGFVFCHPFDDIDLIAGYASSALEVLEDVRNPDVILVCCGGGGLVSGVAAAVSLSKVSNCRVYAVEPQTAPTMYESFKTRRPVTIPHAKSVAAGLAPPYAGSLCYKHCRWFVEDVLLVSDEEMLSAMRVLFDRGIKAEPSGCAAFAALLSGKVPDVEGKKVVVYITGGNVSCSELSDIMQDGR
ncbi:L-threonine dehydratase catabolic TdcB isoform X2 [Aplysia californica]|uniref:L-serine ammonia-lyase n=1 Tax=Aplysia californica TaxID=6500 RepID=A0ABM0K9C4_APLCA|nr:L-threonine dehydratase catabolic TdcB isoform X2 [Aplysia californica]